MSHVIEMIGIRKEFPGIVANDNITLQVEEGEIHAILGENGAGKSTLMSILFGLYHADRGVIKVRGKEVDIKSPNDAFDLGIGMVHQHFQLVLLLKTSSSARKAVLFMTLRPHPERSRKYLKSMALPSNRIWSLKISRWACSSVSKS